MQNNKCFGINQSFNWMPSEDKYLKKNRILHFAKVSIYICVLLPPLLSCISCFLSLPRPYFGGQDKNTKSLFIIKKIDITLCFVNVTAATKLNPSLNSIADIQFYIESVELIKTVIIIIRPAHKIFINQM